MGSWHTPHSAFQLEAQGLEKALISNPLHTSKMLDIWENQELPSCPIFFLEVKRQNWNIPDLETSNNQLLVLKKPCCTHRITDVQSLQTASGVCWSQQPCPVKPEQGQALALLTTTGAGVPQGLLVLEMQQGCISPRLFFLPMKKIGRRKRRERREMFK